MIVYFDVLHLDNEPIFRRSLQDRRHVLKELVQTIPGRAMRSEWTLLDFETEHGITDLKQTFARTIACRQERLILKPLHAPYLSLTTGKEGRLPGYFVKLKKD